MTRSTLRRTAILVLAALGGLLKVRAEHPFAERVLEYAPAPGQFVNHPDFNDPRDALGPPIGAGLSTGNNTTVVSLGGFGGYIVLAFDHAVRDDPLNPFGMDAIVFGNAFWVGGNGTRHWAECATIEISRDINSNGEADDPWYLIPGSHIQNLEQQFLLTLWDDDVADLTYPPSSITWIPPARSGLWQTEGYLLPVTLFGNNVVVNPGGADHEAIWGYAEYSPTLLLGDLDADNLVDDPNASSQDFYTRPDDPFTVGMTPASGGGDAFDIAWAVDPLTGEFAGLDGFDFIRITTAVLSAFDDLGEKSSEIDAVADVAPDPFGDADGDGDIDLADVAAFQACFGWAVDLNPETCDAADRQPDGWVDLQDSLPFLSRLTGPF